MCTQVVENAFQISELPNLDCNSYAFREDETGEWTLVDAGNGINLQALLDAAKSVGLAPDKLVDVVITHVHVDHLLGLYPLLKERRDLGVHALGESARVIMEADVNAVFPGGLGITPRHFGVDLVPVDHVHELKEGDSLEFGQFSFRVLDTPGHCPGSLCLYDETLKLLVTGDVVFAGGSFGRVDFPGGSALKLVRSIKRLAELDVKYLLPGHMDFTEEGNRHIRLSLRFAEQVF